jgi:2-keto-4-pentenoate hydratase/2-oxohepta-3-ene-1,7-dioic acid hydratase in catechol pathway
MSQRFAQLHLDDGRTCFVELADGGAWLLDAAPWLGGERSGERIDGVDDEGRSTRHQRLAPIAPSKIVCIGRNYRAHAAELGNEVPEEPLLFFKPPSSVLAPDGTIELPPPSLSERVDHEVELGLVIATRCRRVDASRAEACVFGYTIVGDITARDLQKKDRQWTRAKGFDTFCPAGPVIVTGLDASALDLECSVSGELRQRGTTAQMVYPPAELIAYISQAMTLEPGDVIATGTPEGVGPLNDGDVMVMRIEGIGELRCPVRATE